MSTKLKYNNCVSRKKNIDFQNLLLTVLCLLKELLFLNFVDSWRESLGGLKFDSNVDDIWNFLSRGYAEL